MLLQVTLRSKADPTKPTFHDVTVEAASGDEAVAKAFAAARRQKLGEVACVGVSPAPAKAPA